MTISPIKHFCKPPITAPKDTIIKTVSAIKNKIFFRVGRKIGTQVHYIKIKEKDQNTVFISFKTNKECKRKRLKGKMRLLRVLHQRSIFKQTSEQELLYTQRVFKRGGFLYQNTKNRTDGTTGRTKNKEDKKESGRKENTESTGTVLPMTESRPSASWESKLHMNQIQIS